MIPSMRAPRRSSWSPSIDHQVDQAGDLATVTHGHVERQDLVAERRLRGREYAVVVGAGLVELGDHDGARHAHLGALAPQGGGGVVDGLAGRDHEQRAVRGAEPGADLAHEVGVPGGVDEVDLGVAVDDGRDGQRDGALVGPLGLLEVADRRALLDRPCAGDGSCGGEQRLDQGGLARTARSDQHHVADPVGAARPEILPGCSTTARLVRHGLPPGADGGPGRTADSEHVGPESTPPGPDVQEAFRMSASTAPRTRMIRVPHVRRPGAARGPGRREMGRAPRSMGSARGSRIDWVLAPRPTFKACQN